MNFNKKSVIDFLSLQNIQSLAIPSNIRYGRAIYERGGVEILTNTPFIIEAWVGGLEGSVAEGGSQRRRIKLFVSSNQLKWHCAGNPKNHQIFCKHCVALTLKLLENPKISIT